MMKNIILVTVMLTMFGLFSSSLAQAEVTTNKDNAQQFITIHQDMIKMHQDAIACAQSGKAINECMQQFQLSMMEKMKQMKPNAGMMPGPMMQKPMGQSGGMMMPQGNMMPQNNMQQPDNMMMQHQGQ